MVGVGVAEGGSGVCVGSGAGSGCGRQALSNKHPIKQLDSPNHARLSVHRILNNIPFFTQSTLSSNMSGEYWLKSRYSKIDSALKLN
jgi:hypothetical protein